MISERLYNNKKSNYIYIFSLILFISAIIALPFIHTDITIKSNGITRPVTERTEVKPIMTGLIDSIF